MFWRVNKWAAAAVRDVMLRVSLCSSAAAAGAGVVSLAGSLAWLALLLAPAHMGRNHCPPGDWSHVDHSAAHNTHTHTHL
jgi:hypothetical protein